MTDRNVNLFSLPIPPENIAPEMRGYLEEFERLLKRLLTGEQFRDGTLHIHRVTQLDTPTADTDSANKAYVDQYICPERVASLPAPADRSHGTIVFRTTDSKLFVRGYV